MLSLNHLIMQLSGRELDPKICQNIFNKLHQLKSANPPYLNNPVTPLYNLTHSPPSSKNMSEK